MEKIIMKNQFNYSEATKELGARLKAKIETGEISPLQALHELRQCDEIVLLSDIKKMLGVK